MQQSSFLRQSETSILSQLQNDFILSQQRTMTELRNRNQSMHKEILQLQNINRQLETELKGVVEQLQFERDQCTTRRIGTNKYKQKYSAAQVALLQMENLNTSLQKQLLEFKNKYETLTMNQEELNGRSNDMVNHYHEMKESFRKLEVAYKLEKDSTAELLEENQALRKRLKEIQNKLASYEKKNQALKLASQQAYDDLQTNIETIQRKVDTLDAENYELRRRNSQLLQENRRNRDQLDELQSRYNFICRKRGYESVKHIPETTRHKSSKKLSRY